MRARRSRAAAGSAPARELHYTLRTLREDALFTCLAKDDPSEPNGALSASACLRNGWADELLSPLPGVPLRRAPLVIRCTPLLLAGTLHREHKSPAASRVTSPVVFKLQPPCSLTSSPGELVLVPRVVITLTLTLTLTLTHAFARR